MFLASMKFWHEQTETPHSYRRAICEKEQGNQRAVVPRTHWVRPTVAVVCNSKEGNDPIRASTGQKTPSTEVGDCLYRLYFMVAILGGQAGTSKPPNPCQGSCQGSTTLLLSLALPPKHSATYSVPVRRHWQGVPKAQRFPKKSVFVSYGTEPKVGMKVAKQKQYFALAPKMLGRKGS